VLLTHRISFGNCRLELMNQTMLLDWKDPGISWLESGEREKPLCLKLLPASFGEQRIRRRLGEC